MWTHCEVGVGKRKSEELWKKTSKTQNLPKSEDSPLAVNGQRTALKGEGIFHCNLWEQNTTSGLRKLLVAELAF